MSISFYIQVCHQIHKKNPIQNSMNVDSDKAGIFHLSFVQNPKLHHEKETIDTDYTTDIFHGKIYSMDELPTPQAMLLPFLAGLINLRKFITTRPEGTRQPDF